MPTKKVIEDAKAHAKLKKKQGRMGRPTKYTQELANFICEKVATGSFGIETICKKYPHLPDPSTIRLWRIRHEDFSLAYAKAKMQQADFLAEEILEIADDARNDWMESLNDNEKGPAWKANTELVQRSRLRIDTRKWIAAKLVPRTYGDYTKEKEDNSQSLIEKMIEFVSENKQK